MSDLNRIRHLAGILTEGVVSVPGMGKQEQPNEVDGMFDKDSNDWAANAAEQHDNQDVGSEFDPKLGEGDMEECAQADMLEEGALKEVIQQKIQRARELQDSMVDPEEASDIIAAELEQEGFEAQEILNIIDAVAEELEGSDEDEDDGHCHTCNGTGIGQHGDPDTSRCSSCGGSGVLRGGSDYDDYDPPEYDPDDDYMGPLEEADEQDPQQQIDDESELNEDELEEAYDLNNGYEDVKYSKGSDYFPTGADSPVTSHTGPSGARQGDNPEQKRMEVAEAHKELVYNYRKFLKESASK